jgi:xanthine/CO dehydrogenase XdhC/CoxF family maturation factor
MGGAVGGGVTARQAFAAAAELATQWQEDAVLSVVSSHWPAVEAQSGGAAEWNFQFFSPSTQRLALVAADGEAARVVRESMSPYVVPTFSAEAWRVDSDQALQTWWDRGGGRWVARRPDTDLAMQLRMPDDGDDDPVWTVVGLVVGAEAAFSVRVNAADGTLLEQ